MEERYYILIFKSKKYTIESKTLVLYSPTRFGYHFEGWEYDGNQTLYLYNKVNVCIYGVDGRPGSGGAGENGNSGYAGGIA